MIPAFLNTLEDPLFDSEAIGLLSTLASSSDNHWHYFSWNLSGTTGLRKKVAISQIPELSSIFL